MGTVWATWYRSYDDPYPYDGYETKWHRFSDENDLRVTVCGKPVEDGGGVGWVTITGESTRRPRQRVCRRCG
jgi:hypothetical protein